MPDGYERVDARTAGVRVTAVFHRPDGDIAFATDGLAYRVWVSSDEDGGHERVTLVPLPVDVLVPRPTKVDD